MMYFHHHIERSFKSSLTTPFDEFMMKEVLEAESEFVDDSMIPEDEDITWHDSETDITYVINRHTRDRLHYVTCDAYVPCPDWMFKKD